MGQAFDRPAVELVETGREKRFFANCAPVIELLPDGNVRVCFAIEHGTMAEAEAIMITSPAALAMIGRMFLKASGDSHNDLVMTRLVAGPDRAN